MVTTNSPDKPFDIGDEVRIQLPEVLGDEHDCAEIAYCDCHMHGKEGTIVSHSIDEMDVDAPCSNHMYRLRLSDGSTFPVRHYDVVPAQET